MRTLPSNRHRRDDDNESVHVTVGGDGIAIGATVVTSVFRRLRRRRLIVVVLFGSARSSPFVRGVLSVSQSTERRQTTIHRREERERELRAVREGCRSELERLKEEVTEREERAAKVLSSTTRKGRGGRGRWGRCGRGKRGRSVL